MLARAFAALALTVLAAPALAQAPSFAGKPIRVVVPFTAGGSSDYAGRLVAENLAKGLGTTGIVENKPGGNTVIGSEFVAKSAPDGHTLLVMGTATLAAGGALSKSLPYDAARDFIPISNVANSTLVLTVHPSVPAKSVAELVGYAKANPGKVNFASAGVGNTLHLAAELFKSRAGIDIKHVPYKGASQALTDMLSGQVQMMFDLIITSQPHITAGKLRALATTGNTRHPVLPDIPTVAESGYPGFYFGSSIGVWGPRGMPDPVVRRLHQEIAKFLQNPELRAEMARRGMEAAPSATPEEFQQAFRDDMVMLAKLIRDAGVQPE
jgi:tripartite-type tricarboxylate transporter receptor subunit TctC